MWISPEMLTVVKIKDTVIIFLLEISFHLQKQVWPDLNWSEDQTKELHAEQLKICSYMNQIWYQK